MLPYLLICFLLPCACLIKLAKQEVGKQKGLTSLICYYGARPYPLQKGSAECAECEELKPQIELQKSYLRLQKQKA